MNAKVRCKLCGYVMNESALKDVCPACGVSRKVFEAYEDPLEPRRRLIVQLDLHSIFAHAPQALTFFVLLLVPLSKALPDAWLDYVRKAVAVMALLLPLSLAGTFLTGLLDGHNRFRKLNTPLLVRKMLFGGLFFVLSVPIAYLARFADWADGRVYLWLNLLNILAFGCSMVLGIIGAELLGVYFVKLGGTKKPGAVPLGSGQRGAATPPSAHAP